MRVVIDSVPHAEQRYNTVGDWAWEDEEGAIVIGGSAMGVLHIRVSDMNNWRMEMAVAIHELTEALLCHAHNIKQVDVDNFDMGTNDPEPGEHPAAPYRREHRAASVPEMFLLEALDVDLREYDEACERVSGRAVVTEKPRPVRKPRVVAEPAIKPTLPCTACTPTQQILRERFGRHVQMHDLADQWTTPGKVKMVPHAVLDEAALRAWMEQGGYLKAPGRSSALPSPESSR